MKSFYFTFGLNHKLSDYYQLIVAENEVAAHRKMFEIHGNEWAFPYTEDEWDEACFEGHTRYLQPLERVEVK